MNLVLRWLDDPPKMFGFTLGQWALGVFGGGGLTAILYFAHVPLTAAASILVLLVGTPMMFVRLSDEGAGINLTGLLRDAVRWRRHPHHYDPEGAHRPAGLVVAAAESRHARRRARRAAQRAVRPGGST